MAYDYEVRVRRLSEEDGGVFLAEVPELPGCMSDGETPEEAARNVQSAIEAWLAAAREDGRPIPAPRLWEEEDEPSGRVSLRLPKSMHRELLEGARRDGVSLNQRVTHLLGLALGMERSSVAIGRAKA